MHGSGLPWPPRSSSRFSPRFDSLMRKSAIRTFHCESPITNTPVVWENLTKCDLFLNITSSKIYNFVTTRIWLITSFTFALQYISIQHSKNPLHTPTLIHNIKKCKAFLNGGDLWPSGTLTISFRD
jgi:hypothetical protein